MAHTVVLKDWTIEITLSDDGDSITITAAESCGSQFKKTFMKVRLYAY